MNHTTVLIFPAVLTSMLLLLATAALSPASPSWCSDELVAFSPCLGTARQSTDTATSQCCDTLSKAFNSGDGNCFCYLIMQPLIFGFPLNESRVIALPSVCSLSSLVSLDLLCSGSPALPPFTAQLLQSPDDLSLAPSLPPESVDGSPRSPVSPLAPASHSPAEKHNSNS